MLLIMLTLMLMWMVLTIVMLIVLVMPTLPRRCSACGKRMYILRAIKACHRSHVQDRDPAAMRPNTRQHQRRQQRQQQQQQQKQQHRRSSKGQLGCRACTCKRR